MTSVEAKETQEKQVNAVPESKEPAPSATTEASEKAPAKQAEDEEEYNEDEDEDFVRERMLTGRSSMRTTRKTTMRRKKRMMTKTTMITKMMKRMRMSLAEPHAFLVGFAKQLFQRDSSSLRIK